jgi:hypothetical protein
MLLILGNHATSFRETNTGLTDDGCEDFLQQEQEDCDNDYCDDDENDDHDDDSDDESYEEKRNDEAFNMAVPVQRNTEDLLGCVSAQ